MGWHLDCSVGAGAGDCSVGAGVVLGGGDEVACVDAEPFEYFLCNSRQRRKHRSRCGGRCSPQEGRGRGSTRPVGRWRQWSWRSRWWRRACRRRPGHCCPP